MVLVHTPYRRLRPRDAARRASDGRDVSGAGLLPVLDATPAGAEVYGRMGFRPVGDLLRWRGTGGASEAASQEPRITDRVHDLDRAAFGADRGAVLADLCWTARARGCGRQPATRATAVPCRPYSDPGWAARRAGCDHRAGAAREGPRRRSRRGHRRRAGAGNEPSPRTSSARGFRPRAALRAAGTWRRRAGREARARPRHAPGRSSVDALAGDPHRGACGVPGGNRDPGPPARARRRAPPRRAPAARLTRYYIDAGAGGLAVGVHTTQFAIRDAGLYRPVLELAVGRRAHWTPRPLFLVAGVAGRGEQAVAEARVARDLGYHAVLASLAAFRDSTRRRCSPTAAPSPTSFRGRLLPAARGRRRRPLALVLGATSRRSRTSSASRSPRSTATALSTSCTAWRRRARGADLPLHG